MGYRLQYVTTATKRFCSSLEIAMVSTKQRNDLARGLSTGHRVACAVNNAHTEKRAGAGGVGSRPCQAEPYCEHRPVNCAGHSLYHTRRVISMYPAHILERGMYFPACSSEVLTVCMFSLPQYRESIFVYMHPKYRNALSVYEQRRASFGGDFLSSVR